MHHGICQFGRGGVFLQQLWHRATAQQNIRQTHMRHFDFVFDQVVSQRGDAVGNHHRALAQSHFQRGCTTGHQHHIRGHASQSCVCRHHAHGQLFIRVFVQQFQQALTRGGGGGRYQKLRVGIALQNQWNGVEKHCAHVINFADAAAWHHGDDLFGFFQFQLHARACFIRHHRQGLGQRMADKIGLPTGIAV